MASEAEPSSRKMIAGSRALAAPTKAPLVHTVLDGFALLAMTILMSPGGPDRLSPIRASHFSTQFNESQYELAMLDAALLES
jgi:hypothetical protein